MCTRSQYLAYIIINRGLIIITHPIVRSLLFVRRKYYLFSFSVEISFFFSVYFTRFGLIILMRKKKLLKMLNLPYLTPLAYLRFSACGLYTPGVRGEGKNKL